MNRQDNALTRAFSPAFNPTPHNRLASLALSAVFTLVMLGGIHTLAGSDNGAAAQLAQASAGRA